MGCSVELSGRRRDLMAGSEGDDAAEPLPCAVWPNLIARGAGGLASAVDRRLVLRILPRRPSVSCQERSACRCHRVLLDDAFS